MVKRLGIPMSTLWLFVFFNLISTSTVGKDAIRSLREATANEPNPKVDYVAKINELARAGRDERLNAAPFYDKAIELYDGEPEELKNLARGAWPAELSAKQRLQLKEWVQSNSQALSQLEQGAKRPYYWVERSSPDGILMQIQMQELAKFRQLCFVIAWRAKLAAEQGNVNEAVADILTCYRFGLHQMGPKTLVEQLVGIAIKAKAMQTAFEILDRTRGDEDSLRALQSQIEQLSAGESHMPDMRLEKLFSLDIIQRIFTDDGKGDGWIHIESAKRMLSGAGVLGEEGLQSLQKLQRRQTTETVEKVFKYFDFVSQKTPWQRKNENINPDKEIEKIGKENVLVGIFCPAFVRVAELFARCRAETDALITTLALLRYKADRGQFPGKLDELASARYLKVVATDPFSGRPFVYKRLGDDFMLYSFGEDCDDDGGQVGRDSKGKVKKWADAGDSVFWPVAQPQMTEKQMGNEKSVARTQQQKPTKSLHQAVLDGDIDQVRLLTSRGAEVNAEDRTGYTPLFYAAERGQKDVAELLIAAGANVNAKDRSGNTPLHYSAVRGYYGMCELLVTRGADSAAENLTGGTALAMAKAGGHDQIVELLHKHRAQGRTFTGIEDKLNRPLPPAGEKIQYKLKFEPGQKYYMRMTTEQKISQIVNGRRQSIDQSFGFGIDCDVEEVEANEDARIKYTYRWAKFRQRMPTGEETSYDSSKKVSPVPPAAQGFAAMLGEGFSIKITPQGRVKLVEGLKTMRNNIVKKLPYQGRTKELMIEALKQYLSEEGIKETTESSMAIYPDKPVGIGDSWNKTVVLSQGLSMIVEHKWTLKERNNGLAAIEVDSTIRPDPQAKPMDMGAAKVRYALSGKQRGRIEMQESTGQIIRSEINQQMSGQMQMTGAGGQSQEMSIPMELEGVVTLEMTEREKVDSIADANVGEAADRISRPTAGIGRGLMQLGDLLRKVPVNENSVGDVNTATDPNAVKVRVKMFPGLEKALTSIDKQGQNEIRLWMYSRVDNRIGQVRGVQKQVKAELDFVRKLAAEERAVKTTAAIDGVLFVRKERYDRLLKDLLEARKGTRQIRSPRGRERGQYVDPRRQYRRTQPGPGTEDTTEPFADPNRIKAKIKGLEERLVQALVEVDRKSENEIREWLQQGEGVDDRMKLARAVQEQVKTELMFVREPAIQEKAKKTTTAIDAVLLTRQQRFKKLVQKMEDEKKRMLLLQQGQRKRVPRRGTRGRDPGRDQDPRQRYPQDTDR